MPDFRTRSYELELMDHPIEDAAAIEQNFDDPQVINRWLGGAGLSIQGLRKLAQERPIDSVVDVGSGEPVLVARMNTFYVLQLRMPRTHEGVCFCHTIQSQYLVCDSTCFDSSNQISST